MPTLVSHWPKVEVYSIVLIRFKMALGSQVPESTILTKRPLPSWSASIIKLRSSWMLTLAMTFQLLINQKAVKWKQHDRLSTFMRLETWNDYNIWVLHLDCDFRGKWPLNNERSYWLKEHLTSQNHNFLFNTLGSVGLIPVKLWFRGICWQLGCV